MNVVIYGIMNWPLITRTGRTKTNARTNHHIGDQLQKAGYKTGIFGKWGLGAPGTEGAPNEQGLMCFTDIIVNDKHTICICIFGQIRRKTPWIMNW